MDTHSRLILDIYDIAQETAPTTCNEELLRRFKHDLAFESAMIGDVGVFGDRLVPTGIYLNNTPTERISDRQRTLGEEIILVNGSVQSRDPALSATFRNRGRSVATDIAQAIDDPKVLAYCRRYETAHSLTYVSDRLLGGRLTAISFWRTQRRQAFRGTAERLANLVLPHLIQARQINTRLHSARLHMQTTVTLLSSREGRLYYAADEAIALMQEEWPEWSPPFLPGPLMAAFRSRSTMDYAGQRVYMRAKVEHAVLTVSLTRQTGSSNGLTAAERRCAVLAAQGLQYKEIANRLLVSPSTVRNQLSSVYRKLNVRNKTGLAHVLDLGGHFTPE
ncbi:LuxR C-terminal-related transcriptional regulator [Massilia sp. CMS3.1]|uniref:helix-turn-helix transcriptional regulator n=1 Tax=Massilia sp. CMS3.1 TaxID=3373083 RepID=UPI003EE80633